MKKNNDKLERKLKKKRKEKKRDLMKNEDGV